MDKQKLLHQFIQSELQRYETLYYKLEEEKKKSPKGSLIMKGNDTYGIALRENGKQYHVTLGPDDKELFEQLKNKRYIHESLPILKSKINACHIFLENDQLYDPLEIENLLPQQYTRPSTDSLFLPGDMNPDEWASAKYPKSTLYPEKLIHNTLEGIKTRSKSEAMIGTQLELHDLIIRYEPLLLLDGQYVCPDFQILHRPTRKIFIWEHLGLIDFPDYTMHNLNKLDLYGQNGYYLGHNLIITYETSEKPLTIEIIEKKISSIIEA